ncbi:hypothetical protein AA0114_g8105 [Alternaria tenuissima]|uniref:Uncharacterized protein n=1 Tax=Alternaria tenuissima TaxID=119927 RepID=A0A4Q4MB82_9PLEO|nr:hypothetical protein AALT_g10691 [Alternaria alternata]RYN46864.1 hypothetical protein AA0114_g8105 [Alternaria tenuissima]
MAPSTADTPDVDSPRKLPTAEELSEALKIDVYDREGKTKALGDLVRGQRTVLVFIRHFFLVVGCGSYQPIDTYATNSSSKYPIYTDPTLRLHKLFKFKSNLAEGKAGDEQRDYMRNAGSTMSRIFGGIKGALGNLQHVNSVGPKALNGGEVVLSADGECEYMYRMQNTVDHTNISELAKMIGAEYISVDGEEKKAQTCNEPAT